MNFPFPSLHFWAKLKQYCKQVKTMQTISASKEFLFIFFIIINMPPTSKKYSEPLFHFYKHNPFFLKEASVF